jgi:predicted Rossmann-fold nucleotide-binding protein
MLKKNKIIKIISGGQTGADRGGLDAAIRAGLPHGGACPKNRLAEDGQIPPKYNMQEMFSPKYAHRTEQNVIDSDATVVFTYGLPQGGSLLTVNLAEKHNKPCLWLDMYKTENELASELASWLDALTIPEIILNVAGSRESTAPGIQKKTDSVIFRIIQSEA